MSQRRRYTDFESTYDDEEDDFGSVPDEPCDFLDPEKSIDSNGRRSSAPEVRRSSQTLSSLPSGLSQQGGGSSKKGPKDPLGFIPVTSPQNPIVDIIFIHGLGGSAWKSWSWEHDSRNFWPPWLALEPELSNARISTFGYTAGITGSSNTMNILEFAKDLLLKMKYEKHQGSPVGSVSSVFYWFSIKRK